MRAENSSPLLKGERQLVKLIAAGGLAGFI